MNSTNRSRLARAVQARTGWPYARCLDLVVRASTDGLLPAAWAECDERQAIDLVVGSASQLRLNTSSTTGSVEAGSLVSADAAVDGVVDDVTVAVSESSQLRLAVAVSESSHFRLPAADVTEAASKRWSDVEVVTIPGSTVDATYLYIASSTQRYEVTVFNSGLGVELDGVRPSDAADFVSWLCKTFAVPDNGDVVLLECWIGEELVVLSSNITPAELLARYESRRGSTRYDVRVSDPRRLMSAVLLKLERAGAGPTQKREGRLIRALIDLVSLEVSRRAGREVSDAELRDFRENLAERMSGLAEPFAAFQFDINIAASNAANDGWYWASLGRSMLQFLLDEYADPRIVRLIDPNNLAEIDEFLQDYRDLAAPLPTSAIPPHLPEEHYWWRLPEQGCC